jgi:cytochrome c551/c552
MLGSVFKSISEKYRGNSYAGTYLAEKITKGASRVWGAIPMPGMPQVAAADIKTFS